MPGTGMPEGFTVMTGTVMERTHIGLHPWMLAFYLLSSSKKGMSSHQLMRAMDVTYKTAWFLSHRVRKAMERGGLASPMGGEGGIVEADETYHGKAEKPRVSEQRQGRPYNIDVGFQTSASLFPWWSGTAASGPSTLAQPISGL